MIASGERFFVLIWINSPFDPIKGKYENHGLFFRPNPSQKIIFEALIPL